MIHRYALYGPSNAKERFFGTPCTFTAPRDQLDLSDDEKLLVFENTNRKELLMLLKERVEIS